MKRFGAWATSAALMVIVLVPSLVLAITMVSRSDRINEISRTPTPLVVEPSVLSTDEPTDGMLLVVTSPGTDVLSSGANGRVTAVHVSPGATIRTGEWVYDVDGMSRIAAYTTQPFYRPLEPGSSGADVVALKQLLGELGLLNVPNPISNKYDTATGQAVRELRRTIGETNPTTVFSPELMVWLPQEEIVIATVLLTPNTNAPGLGEPILRGEIQVESALVSLASGAVPGEGLVGGPITDRSSGAVVGELANTGGEINAYQPGLLRVLADNLRSDGDGANPSETHIGVTLRRASATERQIIPASAVVTDISGATTCVWTSTNDGWSAVGVAVTSSGEAGSVALGDALPQGTRILANPVEVLAVATCPSK